MSWCNRSLEWPSRGSFWQGELVKAIGRTDERMEIEGLGSQFDRCRITKYVPPASPAVAPSSSILQLIVPPMATATAPSLFIPSPAVLPVLEYFFVATKVLHEGQHEDRVQGEEERRPKADCEVRGIVGKSRVGEEQACTAF